MCNDKLFSGGAYVAPQGGLTLRDRFYFSVRASTESALRLAWQAACENRKAGYRFRVGRVQGCNPAYDERRTRRERADALTVVVWCL